MTDETFRALLKEAHAALDKLRAMIAADTAYLEARAAVPEVWHAPGLGEVHSADHKHMVYCESACTDSPSGYKADDALARRVSEALAMQPVATVFDHWGGRLPGDCVNVLEFADHSLRLPIGTTLYAVLPAKESIE